MHLERSRFTEHRKALYFSERGRLGAVARRQKAFIDFIPQVEEHVDGLWSIWWGTLEGRGGNPLKMTLSTVSSWCLVAGPQPGGTMGKRVECTRTNVR